MNSKLNNILAFVIVLLIGACNKPDAPDCLQLAGELGAEWRTTEAYDKIEIRDNIHVILVDSMDSKIKVEGPINLIPEITTRIEGGVMIIQNENTCNAIRSFKNQYTVTIYAPQFHAIENAGTGDISSGNLLTTDYLFLENKRSVGKVDLHIVADSIRVLNTTGYSDIELRGTCHTSYLFHQGLGIMDASELYTTKTFINSNSINNSHVRFTEYLFAALQSNGNIYYRGPSSQIDANHNGSGSLIAE
jgi:Putative auto-transporter adhesin, head GIN domain